MVTPIHDLGEVGAEETTSPCSLTALMIQYTRDINKEHAGFMDELRVPLIKAAPSAHLAATTEIYSELRRGIRELAWVPAGLNILRHFHEFFLRWNVPLGVETIVQDQDYSIANMVDLSLKSETSSPGWVVGWRLEGSALTDATRSSGIRMKPAEPDAVTLCYMIARAVFRGQKVPFASTSDKILFARTCTRIQAERQMAVAYIPGRAVYFRSFPVGENNPYLVSSGLISINPVR